MMLSSLSICRLVKTINPHYGVWVDKSKSRNPDPNIRYCAFRFYDEDDAMAVAEGMKTLIETGGFDNRVKITRSRDWTCEVPVFYVRIVAQKM
jgi:hypothetical protein